MKDNLSYNLGRRLMETRKSQGYTQQEVADNIDGLTVQMISSYETGKSKPCIENLIKFCNFYNISLDYVCRGIKKENNENYDFNNYSDLFRLLKMAMDRKIFSQYSIPELYNNKLALFESNNKNVIDFLISLKVIENTKKVVSNETYKQGLEDLFSKYSNMEIE